MSNSNENPEFYRTPEGNLTNQKIIPLNREKWLAEEYESNGWISMVANPSWKYFAEDMFSAELPFQKHIYLCKMRIKSRGNNQPYTSITVGAGIMTKPPKGYELKIWIISEIQVSSVLIGKLYREYVRDSPIFS